MKKTILQFLLLISLFFLMWYGLSKIDWISIIIKGEFGKQINQQLVDNHIMILQKQQKKICEI